MPETGPARRRPRCPNGAGSGTIAGSDIDPDTMTATRRHHQRPAAARGRLLLWLVAMVLLLQLVAAVGHDHDGESRAQECVACALQAQSPATPPAPRAVPGAFAPVLAQVLAAPGVVVRTPRPLAWLLPQPQAPPDSSPAL